MAKSIDELKKQNELVFAQIQSFLLEQINNAFDQANFGKTWQSAFQKLKQEIDRAEQPLFTIPQFYSHQTLLV